MAWGDIDCFGSVRGGGECRGQWGVRSEILPRSVEVARLHSISNEEASWNDPLQSIKFVSIGRGRQGIGFNV